MRIELHYEAGRLWLRGAGLDLDRGLDDVAPLTALIAAYAALRRRAPREQTALDDVEAGLRQIGEQLYAWLDGPQSWLQQLFATLTGAFELEVQTSLQPDAAGWALLHAPWEVLADAAGFLAAQARVFAPVRRLGPAQPSAPADGYRLGIGFMAAAPRGQQDLDHEAEETAIQAEGVKLRV